MGSWASAHLKKLSAVAGASKDAGRNASCVQNVKGGEEAWDAPVHSVTQWRDGENKVLRATQLSAERKALQ